MKESTKNASKMLGIENAEKTVHLYLYARYLTHYIYHLGKPVGLVEKKPEEQIPPEIEEMIEVLAGKVAREVLSPETSTYHAKIVTLANAEDLLRVEEDVGLTGLERVIPFKVARDIVLENPLKITLFDCGCRMLQNNPCEPIDVCLAVGDPMASFIIEHDVLNARKVSCDEAVEILRAEHRRGHVHGAYFKDVVGGRFYAICNCCPCCCIGMQAWLKLEIPILAPSGYLAGVSDECTGCGDCAEICPFDAIEMNEKALVEEERCMGCGVCEGACDFDAISLELEPSKGVPLDINKIISERAGKGESAYP